jgi:hypothetical protein
MRRRAFFLALLAGVFLYARRQARYVEVPEHWELERLPELASCLREVLVLFFRRPRQDDNGGGSSQGRGHGDGSCGGSRRTRTRTAWL